MSVAVVAVEEVVAAVAVYSEEAVGVLVVLLLLRWLPCMDGEIALVEMVVMHCHLPCLEGINHTTNSNSTSIIIKTLLSTTEAVAAVLVAVVSIISTAIIMVRCQCPLATLASMLLWE